MEGRIVSKKNWRKNPEIGRNPKSYGRKDQQEQKEKKSVNWKKTHKRSMEGAARTNGEEISELQENTLVFNRWIGKNKWRGNPINWGKKKQEFNGRSSKNKCKRYLLIGRKQEFTIVQQQAELLSV
jgi:hypothetical protein